MTRGEVEVETEYYIEVPGHFHTPTALFERKQLQEVGWAPNLS